MTSKELLYIKTIVEEGNISAAAKKLYMSQPSLSQSLKRIEKSLNCDIFIRSTNGLKLTFAGEKYYKTASKILKLYEDMKLQISNINDLKIGRIKFGITNHLARLILPDILPEFKKEYPNIEINIIEDTSLNLEKYLINCELDFALMHIFPNSDFSHLKYELLSSENFVILSSYDENLTKKAKHIDKYKYPVLDLKDIQHLDFISLSKNQSIKQMQDIILKKAGINNINNIFTLKSYLTALELVSKGMGIMIFPEKYINYYKSKGEFSYKNDNIYIYSIPKQYEASWNLSIVHSYDTFLTKADEILLDIIRKRNINDKK